jgi:YD repeat-containing protein
MVSVTLDRHSWSYALGGTCGTMTDRGRTVSAASSRIQGTMAFLVLPLLVAVFSTGLRAEPWPGPCRVEVYPGLFIGPNVILTYTYGANDKVETRSIKHVDGSEVITEYIYDDLDRVVSEQDSDGGWAEHERSDDGVTVDRVSPGRRFDGGFRTSVRYHVTPEIARSDMDLDGDGQVDQEVVVRLEAGKLLERMFWIDGTLTRRLVNTYDDSGLLQRTDITDIRGEESTYLYTYDASGNLIEKVSDDRQILFDYSCW